ncbi:fumarylacetoacetate hydrolase family protein [Sansalvadorimonas sp. 2012CJ34-2]|uniref:Fumarylacetoacetate hydrolase family protein n=1 Tax=Parendozoicomonas callyspongiae TaxID=2942213 RepID=A0ABT0PAI6_9GAMM|nr:fumarylacetoacetate hydrolase family protein [Sansalvadorimonas sp. 2012CJ34-2]MCL6268399.1 fumarylacetoacetate hydrolase family protein [Sansalvadorimonas sp. 2012CJ34-2]
MGYQHQWFDGSTIDLPVGKVVCVGRNYAEHAKELNNPIPVQPLLFMKPATSLVPMNQPVQLRQDSIHYETEIALLISEPLTRVSETEAEKGIGGLGVALDLTLRDLQSCLKEKGHPWEIAKGFDGACPVSEFVSYTKDIQLDDIAVRLTIDDEIRQDGNSAQMLTGILALLSYISQHFTLQPGDIVLTGTPKGVGQLNQGMRLVAELPDLVSATTSVN